MDWVAQATNWAKFTVAASLGVIHKGHIKEALNLLSAYLPKDSVNKSPYSEGGALYALGLVHANHGGDIIEYLINQLRSTVTQTNVNYLFFRKEKLFRNILDYSTWCLSWFRFSCHGYSPYGCL
jgi:hypothetical protein